MQSSQSYAPFKMFYPGKIMHKLRLENAVGGKFQKAAADRQDIETVS